MLDRDGAAALAATVEEVGSVEETAHQIAVASMASTLLAMQKGDMIASMLGEQEGAAEMVADMIQPELEAQALALLFAGAFLYEQFPDEMEAYFAKVSEAAEAPPAFDDAGGLLDPTAGNGSL